MPGDKSDIQIRAAGPDDARAIAAALLESFAEYRDLYTDEGFAATTPASEQVLSRMGEGPVWVAACDDLIVGTVSVVPRGESLYVRGMAVLPSARGRRVGEALLRTVEEFARAQGHTRLFLSTTPFLSRAIKLYERAGFRRVDEGPQDLCGTSLFTMEKEAGPSR
jgi:GNAT superfamily N-acetyltransferase